MMEGYQAIPYFLTNGLRLILGLCFLAKLTSFSLGGRALLFAILGDGLVTVLGGLPLPGAVIQAFELFFMAAITWRHMGEKRNLFLFLIFFYEVGTGLWDFLITAGLGILFRSERFVDTGRPEYLAGIWLVRLLMAGAVVLLAKRQANKTLAVRLASLAAILGLFGAVTLSEQTFLPLDEEQVGSWIILSMVLLFAILFYRINRQREMELEIGRLKQNQAEILERNYRTLSRIYEDNARLYHDLHNHIETIYQCLIGGDIQEAVRYCEDLRTPAREGSQTVWTGDKALDYLISSKVAMAEQAHIKTEVNIEYPRNTSIRSADLTAILGNLLDNALEAAKTAPDPWRFLKLTIRRINAMLIIKVENGYGESPRREEGRLVTTKADKALHGWGLKSIRTAAQSYDGTLETSFGNQVFCAVVTLSFDALPVK